MNLFFRCSRRTRISNDRKPLGYNRLTCELLEERTLLSVSPGSTLTYLPETGHYYEFIGEEMLWDQAKAAAESKSFMGVQGHLATLTTTEENAAVAAYCKQYVNDSQFPLGVSLGGQIVNNSWTWLTGETWNYTNWWAGEPNNLWPGEDRLMLFLDEGRVGEWNDISWDATGWGYVVEYDVDAPPASLDTIYGRDTAVRFQPLAYTVDFTDVGTLDTHEAVIDWGDGIITAGIVDQGAGFGTVTGDHFYTELGDYTITYTVTDDDLGVTSAQKLVSVVPAFVGPEFLGSDQVALFVGGSVDHDALYVKQYANGRTRVTMNNPVYRELFELPEGAEIYVYSGDLNDWVKMYHKNESDANIFAGSGHDAAFGGGGDDLIEGNGGNDSLFGWAGDDTLLGGDGKDHLFGMQGDDSLFGGEGADFLHGHGGDDSLDGGAGNDFLYGHAGNDTLIGGKGDDRLYGHTGDNTLFGNEGDDHLYGGIGNDKLDGGQDNDWLYAYAGNDILRGGLGDDRLFAHSGNDILVGNEGRDRLYGGFGRDLLLGGDGRDDLFGGTGDDILIGGTSVYENDDVALFAILAEWTRAESIDDRIDAIKSNFDQPLGDDLRDQLFGSFGGDWYYLDGPDWHDWMGPGDRMDG
jgi:Ca2+-binding RTX toxin-like protein